MWRGFKGRLFAMARKRIMQRRRAAEAAAATKIQAVIRGRIQRVRFAEAQLRDLEMRADIARPCVESWDEDGQTKYFFNESTGEAAWEPPPSGYVRLDGMFVLNNGKIVPDPAIERRRRQAIALGIDPDADDEAIAAAEAEKFKEDPTKLDDEDICVECSALATKFCEECNDTYCDDCFATKHDDSRWANHIFRQMRTIFCIECESVVATRWCESCDDPFCAPCFRRIHKKGKKQEHQWQKVGANTAMLDDGTLYASHDQPDESDPYYDPSAAGGAGWGDQWAGNAGYAPAPVTMQEGGGWDDDAGGDVTLPPPPLNTSGYTGYDESYGQYEGSGWDQSAVSGGGWQEYSDEQGNRYWYDAATGASSWEDPFGQGF